MREIYQNIIFVVIIILLIALAILFYTQQKTISQLKKSNITASAVNMNVDKVDRDQKNTKASIKFISGKLISISENVLTVEADMPDWKKMKEPRTGSKTSLTYKKTYIVTIDDKTQFYANKLGSIKPGDTVGVASKELVYETEKLTAIFIMSPNGMMPGS